MIDYRTVTVIVRDAPEGRELGRGELTLPPESFDLVKVSALGAVCKVAAVISLDWNGGSTEQGGIGKIMSTQPETLFQWATTASAARRAVTGLPSDISAGKHGGNAESAAAHRRARPGLADAREEVLAAVRKHGRHGATCKEVAAQLLKEMHAVSGRLSELKRAGRVTPTGERREGGAVLRAV